MKWTADMERPGETRCEINGLVLQVWCEPTDKRWCLLIWCLGVFHRSPHRTRREARETGVAIAELLTKGKK